MQLPEKSSALLTSKKWEDDTSVIFHFPDQHEIFWLEVPYITHHGHPSHHGYSEPSRRYRYGRPKVLLPWPVFPHQSWDQVPPVVSHCDKTKNKQNLAHHSPLRLQKTNHFIISFRKILDQVACLEEQFGNEAFPFPPQQLVHVFFHC